jgi:hypothetical protein
MKKNLRNLLVLSLGLITTIASAQWGATSTSWIDNTESDARALVNRTTLTVDLSSIHVSADYYSVWDNVETTQGNANVYEAYASTDVMGFGTLTLGRQDLSFGSGALVGSNNWGPTRYTTDGLDFAASFSGIDINAGTMSGINANSNYVNAGGSFAGVSVNLLMIDNKEVKSHGYDFGYSMMDGALTLSYSMNDDGLGSEMTEMGGSYNVFENMSINASMRSYEGDDTWHSFTAPNSAWSEGLYAGEVMHQDNGTEILSYGLTYNLGDIGISYTMHTLSEDDETVDMGGVMTDVTYADVELTDMSLTYQLNDNCTLGYRSFQVYDALNGYGDMNVITVQIGL